MSRKLSHRRRQARGHRRIDQILAAAERVFAEAGYQAATTNAIAARAGISPGSLYQFFESKDAIAVRLASRYSERLREAQRLAFGPELVLLPLGDLLDRVVDPLVAFNIANPGFQALFTDAAVPARVGSATKQLHQAVMEQVESMIAGRAPALPTSRRRQCARVSVQIFRGLLPLVLSSKGAARRALIREVKSVLRGYLAPVIGVPRPRIPRTASKNARRRALGEEPMNH